MSDEYSKENKKYKLELAKYKTAKALTSSSGQISLMVLTFAGLAPFAVNSVLTDIDTNGTENRTEVLAQLQIQEQTLMQSINSFETQRAKLNSLPNSEAQSEDVKTNLKEKQTQLNIDAQTFFATLLTSGSMNDGLAISEQDAEDIINKLQSNVDDFDWGKHVDSNIPDIIENVTNNADYLDESRAEHRYDKSDTLKNRFATAVKISDTKSISEDNSILVFLSLMVSILLSFGPALIADGLQKSAKQMKKPQRPIKPPSH